MDTEDNKEDLVHCVYTSAQTIEFSQDDIVALLEKARIKNSALGVTGMLLCDSGSFFQILEGTPEAVMSLLTVIQRDKRHDRVVKVIYESIEVRDFSEWTMGYSGVTREDLKSIEGLNDFFHTTNQYTDLDEGRAKTLLKAFKEGKWRSSLS
ncbi:BLUF domain-containing protein [Neptunomonas japonica]|uniref:Phosphonate transporter n=1 Tax=Neptunomonas japonica JAMM 1380 TaxID=1441457 RepID=A0A7R6PR73_9GAMM|nr:BLUF domain-containing protein [Neptunomonas japonica]BBB31137.1 phosphonate transporter [Neptunomonas japonica JAMM 1380]